MIWTIVAVFVSLLAFGVAGWLYTWVKNQPSSNPDVKRISSLIRDGANIFLYREYKLLAYFVLATACLILLFLPRPIWNGDVARNLTMTGAYIAGSIFSGLA